MEKEKKKKNYLIDGPVTPEKVATMIANHQTKTGIGAHSIFMGQVRADKAENSSEVSGIDYSAYDEMVNKVISEIREEAFEQWDLNCLHILHSKGLVTAGEISLVVMVSSPHRADTFPSLEYLVNEIKKRVPIWKKELFEDGTHRWIEGENWQKDYKRKENA